MAGLRRIHGRSSWCELCRRHGGRTPLIHSDRCDRIQHESGASATCVRSVVHRRRAQHAASIEHAFRNEDEAVEYALGFGRGLDREKARRFVLMYVNEYTRDMGEKGRLALETLLGRAVAADLVPPVPAIELV